MRRLLCAALCSCILGFGSLMAGDLTTAQAQQLVSAAQSAQPGGKPIEATLSIDGKNVAFTVTRDTVGNVIARPVPGPDSAGITVSQVSIQMKAAANGALSPTSIVVVSSTQTIASYSVQLNEDGTIASLFQAGSFAGGTGGGGNGGALPVVGGIGASTTAISKHVSSLPPEEPEKRPTTDRYPGFTSGQMPLPAGAGTGEVSHSRP
jgi:hypothetical protein